MDRRAASKRPRSARVPVLLLVILLATALTLATGGPAAAQQKGKAEPKIAAGLSEGSGLERTLTVRLTDIDNGKAIPGATVVAFTEMEGVPAMFTPSVRLSREPGGIYTGKLAFLHPGAWVVRIRARGPQVIAASARLRASVEAAPVAEPQAGGQGGHVIVLGTTIEDDELGGGDYARMANLWLHSLATLGWIIGVLAMVLALSVPVGVVTEDARSRIASAYREWGAWIHWSFVPVIVGTGVYNMLYVTPFPLAYTRGDLDRLRAIPYGLLYEGILVAKLGMFIVLLVTATLVLVRVVRTPLPRLLPATNPHPPGATKTAVAALGPAGILYLATIPLIVGAAMSLRYVHVLSHVAEGKAALSGRADTGEGGARVGGHERPLLVFQRASHDERNARVGLLSLAGNQRQTLTKLVCERVYFAGARGLCLMPDHAAFGWVYEARVFGPDFRIQRVISLPGINSRARVSSDGRYGATTGFVSGHSHSDHSLSTQTFILDLARGKKIANLEDFAVYHRGRKVTAEDRNFWGITFAADSNRFYATMATGGKTYLIEGNISRRTGRTLHENVECPSLSPDGTRVAYKRRVPNGWRLYVLDLATGAERPTAETRSFDDQPEWLDDERIIYGRDTAIWMVRADGSDAPRKFVDAALSPAVVRDAT